ncbi:T-complex protein 11-domain-containing protein [Crassisporium funariophilum]|nr:T-complex protein 11-domain-containing protein [Crassisporium funariophilum]
MDDLAHHRLTKRKADQDDCQDSSPTDPVVSDRRLSEPSCVPGPSSNAPRQPWLASETNDNLWNSPTSPQVPNPLNSNFSHGTAKRPRIDTHDSTLRAHGKRISGRSPTKMVPPRMAAVRHGSDIEDIGIVSTADPGPSTGSLLRERPKLRLLSPRTMEKLSTTPPIDLSSPHLPAMTPLINRQTLKELELDTIFRNPQLRHDLLFDSGLQFRPRRKREASEKYWNAVWEEIQTGCTCVTLDSLGKPQPTICICSQFPSTPANPVIFQKPANLYTVRMPSRIPGLLWEFREVLLLVVQPLATILGVYVNANQVKEQIQEHTAHATYLRSVFDPVLIEQELKHNVFDPSGLFAAIGDTLKNHCAPMRDRAVEEMVQAAQRPGVEAFKAVRMCLELLELMKLDIANHQLTQLRPFLIRQSAQFESKGFKKTFGADSSLHNTRQWLHSSHESLLARKNSILHPSNPSDYLDYPTMTKNQQVYLCALKGVVDMVFDASPVSQPPSPSTTPPSSPICSPSATSAVPTIPETLYLDKSRLSLLASEAADTTTLYMFMLLFRQLVYSESSDAVSAPEPPKLDQGYMMRLKQEICDIGPSRLGACFSTNPAIEPVTPVSPQVSKEIERRRNSKQCIVLQIAKRAYDIRHTDSSETPPSSPMCDAPDQRILSVAQHWAECNMQNGSPLSVLLHNRLREVVFDAVVSLAYPGRDSATGKTLSVDFFSNGHLPPSLGEARVGTHATGMESLTDEIKRLAEKISRLALIHLNAYLPLYETEGFLESRPTCTR